MNGSVHYLVFYSRFSHFYLCFHIVSLVFNFMHEAFSSVICWQWILFNGGTLVSNLLCCSRECTHRVKSVSMSMFTSQEVDALKKGGNQVI